MEEPKLTQATIPPVILTGLLELADQYRVETARWFAGTGLDRARLEQPRTLVSYRQAITVIRRALKELPAGPLGLMIGSRDPLLTWGTLGTAVRSASTGAEALKVATQFHQGAGTMLDYVVSRTDQGNVVELLPRTHEPDLMVFLSEEAFAGIVVLTRLMFGPSSGPLAAELSYPPPPWAAAYTRLWRCPVTFDCEHTTLTMASALEERRVPTANATQFEAALQATRALLDSDPVDDLVATVEGTLRQDLRSRRTATQVADALGMSPRTLHRHLAKAGYSFGTIQDRVRRQQADVLLMQTRRSITAIAAELGYSDPREFRRAYKRWTNTTPTQARHQSTRSVW
ncbi:AraC family transcriptional regulator [Streptomyces jeddahensis]|uniref:HTH-type transcriptional regulator VirS n=1 Tax=Streptomyces jeddahensis TaxID=1716141 RepID=A0A177HIR0_9ACTN|nr:AraC family transcriptional regulator [Streptomyces jeddahensis]OAH10277.1 HTH-type transcriptional regulator VirS [Streptomyces jeddahensis]